MSCELGLQPGLCLGPLPIRFYGIIIVLGILVGGFVAAREARFRGENPDRIWDALIWIAIAGIIGARLYHVFSTPAGCAETTALAVCPASFVSALHQSGEKQIYQGHTAQPP